MFLVDRRVVDFVQVEAITWRKAAEQLVEELARENVQASQIATITAFNNSPDGLAKLAAFLKQKEEKQDEGVENPNEGGGPSRVVSPASLKFYLQNECYSWAEFNEKSMRFAHTLHGDQLISITNCSNEDGRGVAMVWYRCYGVE